MTRDKALLEAMAAAIYKSDNFVFGSPAFDHLDAGIQQAYVRAAEASLSAAEAHGWVMMQLAEYAFPDAPIVSRTVSWDGDYEIHTLWFLSPRASATPPQEDTGGR